MNTHPYKSSGLEESGVRCLYGLSKNRGGISCGRPASDPIHQTLTIEGCTHGDGCPVHPDVHAVHNFDAEHAERLPRRPGRGYQGKIESLTARMAAALVLLRHLRAEVSIVNIVPGHDDRSRFRENIDKITETLTMPEPKPVETDRVREVWAAHRERERTGISDRNAVALAAAADLRRSISSYMLETRGESARDRSFAALDLIEQALRAGGAA